MQFIDYLAIAIFFLLMVLIGSVSYRKIKNSNDFFVAGGNVPWWLAGISHHVSGYSGAVFVGYALVAYEYGLTLYFWWAIPITLACLSGSFLIAPRWARLRTLLAIQSPTEYLSLRYNIATQQLIAWSGVLLKLFDVAAKWASMGILLYGFTGLPVGIGIMMTGGVSLLYITIGGLWADLWTDLAQFIVQIVAGLVMFVAVLLYLGGADQVFTVWSQLPEGHTRPFNGSYTPGFVLAFIAIAFLSYNGGTWNLATRYISAPSGSSARKSALLSAALYLVWPLILFFPMWVSPLVFPDLEDASKVYPMLAREFLPAGLVGLVLASMFANTMSMTTSDANTISSVITRDILPKISTKFHGMSGNGSLKVARTVTVLFTLGTLLIALNAEHFGGVLGLLITWFAALLGPTAIPMLFGLLPTFRHCGPKIAISSIVIGLVGFLVVTYGIEVSQAVQIATPMLASLTVFTFSGMLNRKQEVPLRVQSLLEALKETR